MREQHVTHYRPDVRSTQNKVVNELNCSQSQHTAFLEEHKIPVDVVSTWSTWFVQGLR